MSIEITESFISALQQLNSTLERIENNLDGYYNAAQADQERLVAALEHHNELFQQWKDGEKLSDRIDKHEAAELLKVHPGSLQRYRKQWIEGIHYFPGPKITYSRLMLMDWQANRYDPAAHQRTIELFARRKQERLQSAGKRRRKI